MALQGLLAYMYTYTHSLSLFSLALSLSQSLSVCLSLSFAFFVSITRTHTHFCTHVTRVGGKPEEAELTKQIFAKMKEVGLQTFEIPTKVKVTDDIWTPETGLVCE